MAEPVTIPCDRGCGRAFQTGVTITDSRFSGSGRGIYAGECPCGGSFSTPNNIGFDANGLMYLLGQTRDPRAVARALLNELDDAEKQIRSYPSVGVPQVDTSAADASLHRQDIATVRRGLFESVFNKRFSQMAAAERISVIAEARQVLESVLKGAARVATGTAILIGAYKAPEVASAVAVTITSGEDQVECAVGEHASDREQRPGESTEGGEVVVGRESSHEEDHGQAQQQNGGTTVHAQAGIVMSRHEVFFAAKAAGSPEALANLIGVPPYVIRRAIEIGITDVSIAQAILDARTTLPRL